MLAPVHPGEILGEVVLPALAEDGVDRAAFARRIGLSGAELGDLLSGSLAVSTALADRIGEVCGNGPDLWLNLQRSWDERH